MTITLVSSWCSPSALGESKWILFCPSVFTCKYVTCEYSQWSDWSASCGRGMTRTKTLTKVNQHTKQQQGGCSGLQTECAPPQTQTKNSNCECGWGSPLGCQLRVDQGDGMLWDQTISWALALRPGSNDARILFTRISFWTLCPCGNRTFCWESSGKQFENFGSK